MQFISTRVFSLGLAFIAGIFAVIHSAPQAVAQTGPGWITLLDAQKMGDWDQVGASNWRLEDGAVVADTKTSEGAAHLLSKESYTDFMLHIEFWASDDANSGIFLRCNNREKINDRNCYEANIFDQRKDPSYGTGAIVRHVEIDPMPKAGGKWNTYEITVKGRDISVMLNGETTAVLRSGLLTEGPFSLQHGAGVIKFRKVAIKPL
ncbi:MAG TPA: DUF1080 domain-containing protein [Thermohalobaculum sp.]|nr:DUF1080 domain-containing protein [Thermohalobaculum sp.]